VTNQEIKAFRMRIESDDLLTKDEQLFVLQQLYRANRRIQEARKAGFSAEPVQKKGAR
jgi:hypothetical protein